jgi:mannosyltransferase OCH1-like enzyme
MIPKVIHYCWFGRNEKNKKTLACIASWKKYCPDYKIIEWNEDNFNLDYNGYTRYCYDNKKWAFLSDFVRLVVVSEQGGLYFDTDVEVVKSFDSLLKYGAFYSFENVENINTGQGFGAEAHHPTVEEMKRKYEMFEQDINGEYPIIRCPQLNTEALLPFGLQLNGQLQKINDVQILPAEYMNPYDDLTGRLKKTKNTMSIHWYSKSWLDKKTVLRSKLTKPIHRIFGVDFLKFHNEL